MSRPCTASGIQSVTRQIGQRTRSRGVGARLGLVEEEPVDAGSVPGQRGSGSLSHVGHVTDRPLKPQL